MRLIGLNRSPFVRRTAIGMTLMGFDFKHEPISAFRDAARFAAINPVIKAPTLILDNGRILMESNQILDYFEARPDKARSLRPDTDADLVRALGSTGLALSGAEKANQVIQERFQRDDDKLDAEWLERITGQLHAALALVDAEVKDCEGWLFEADPMMADITIACFFALLKFALADEVTDGRHVGIERLWGRAEALPVFAQFPVD